MELTKEHLELARSTREFVNNEINPYVEQWEENESFPAHELFKKMGAMGFLGITKPAAYGGLELDYTYNLMFAEEIGACKVGAIPMAVGVQTDMATPALAAHGSDELRKEFLAPAIAGTMVAAIGLSEPGAGSDLANVQTTGKRQGGDYVINGTKMWITNGAQADFVTVLLNTSDGPSHKNKSLVIVPTKTRGVSVSKPFKKIGMRSSDTVQIFFDEVKIPVAYRIGEENQGFMLQMHQLVEERLFSGASCLKRLENCIQWTIDYTKQRSAFGKSVLDNQVVHFRLAELQTEIEALRSLVYRAGGMYVAGKDVQQLTAMVKLKAGRLSREVSDACLQYWGGMGFMWENLVAQSFRDGRVLSIGAGADEVMLSIICKTMGTLPSK